MLHVFRHRDLRLTVAARAVSAFGDNLALIVLTLRVYSHGLGPWSVTGLLVCAAIPTASLAPVAGKLADSLSFRRLAVLAAVWQAGCCVGLAGSSSLLTTYVLVVALQVGGAVAGPTWQALLPALTEPDELGAAVSASQATTMLAVIAAPAAAGLAVGWVGYGAPMLVDAATFVVLAAAALCVRTRRTPSVETNTDEPPATFALRSDTILFPLVVGICMLVLVGGVTNVVEVFLIRGTLGASATVFGLVTALFVGALVAGAVVAGRAVNDTARALRASVAALLIAIALACGGLAPTIWLFAVAWVVLGIANGAINADVSTLMLNRTPEAFRGRVLARVGAMVSSAEICALAIGGAAGSVLGARTTFVASGALMAVVAVALLLRLARGRVDAALDMQLDVRPVRS
ncbi:MAG TPA: MFS transporter, partial [Candidatus Elarobacter sp.]|nr:MFS transporter [Candidatus Elarobacter sp.]